PLRSRPRDVAAPRTHRRDRHDRPAEAAHVRSGRRAGVRPLHQENSRSARVLGRLLSRARNARAPGRTMTASAGTATRRRARPDYAVYVYPVMTLAVVFLAWEAAARAGYFPRYILPAPTGIAARFIEFRALIARELLVTMEETLAGFALSVAVGVPL